MWFIFSFLGIAVFSILLAVLLDAPEVGCMMFGTLFGILLVIAFFVWLWKIPCEHKSVKTETKADTVQVIQDTVKSAYHIDLDSIILIK